MKFQREQQSASIGSIPSCQLTLNSSTSISLISQNGNNAIPSTNSSTVLTTMFIEHFCLALFLFLHVRFNTTKVFLQLCDQSSWIFPWHLLERECGGRNTGTEVLLVESVRFVWVSHNNVLSNNFRLAVRAICLFCRRVRTANLCETEPLQLFVR